MDPLSLPLAQQLAAFYERQLKKSFLQLMTLTQIHFRSFGPLVEPRAWVDRQNCDGYCRTGMMVCANYH
jgi:hypothetical protein